MKVRRAARTIHGRPALAMIGIALLGFGLSSCGGGGGGGNVLTTPNTPANPKYTAGQYLAASTFANQCATPRTGRDPVTNAPYTDTPGSAVFEKFWLRSWSHDLYLWYSELPDLDPTTATTTADYFAALKTSAITPSGANKDKFHFTYPTIDWEQLSQAGVSVGYGLEWSLVSSAPPREAVVAYTDLANSPNPTANIARGAEVVTADGVDVANGTNVDALNAAFFPTAAGSHTFVIRDAGASTTRSITLQAGNVTENPVQNVKVIDPTGARVGYMLFNDHIATAEQALVDAINTLKTAQVTDLVLDIRYNGGGYLDIASELSYMIAGPAMTTGKTFEQTVFNDRHPTTDPVTSAPLTPTLFHTTTQGFSVAQGQALPTLNLNRLYVLTSADTCSASEAIINGLTGAGVQVVQIGSTTCGKPYGFYPQDNCGTTYFSIEFKGVNNAGFGDYTDGFTPKEGLKNPRK